MGLQSPWNGHSIPEGNPWAYPHHKTRVIGPEPDEPEDEEDAAQIQMAVSLSLSLHANEVAGDPDDQVTSGMAGASADEPDDTSVVVDTSDKSDDVEDAP